MRTTMFHKDTNASMAVVLSTLLGSGPAIELMVENGQVNCNGDAGICLAKCLTVSAFFTS
jgi:hypothetical protein